MLQSTTIALLRLSLCIYTILSFFVLTAVFFSQQPHVKSIQFQEIVSYSLKKQFEFGAKTISCQTNHFKWKEQKKGWVSLKGGVFLFSAHFDRRLAPEFYFVRSVAMVKKDVFHTGNKWYCQLLAENGRVHVGQAQIEDIWHESWDVNDTHAYYHPVLVSCIIPSGFEPILMTLNAENGCQQTNPSIKIPKIATSAQTNEFTVCVKPLNYEKDMSRRILQWAAINSVFFNGTFQFYSLQNAQNLNLVRKMSEKSAKFKLTEFETIESGSDVDAVWQKRRYELVAYNDCLYRNIHLANYIVPLDIDEVIAPRYGNSWQEVLQHFQTGDFFASYTVSNTYFLRQFNHHAKTSDNHGIFFFCNVIRTEFSPNGESGKSFVSTRNALTISNHGALKALKAEIQVQTFLSPDLIQMNHYKDGCDSRLLPQCDKYLYGSKKYLDNLLFRYMRQFFANYKYFRQFLIQ